MQTSGNTRASEVTLSPENFALLKKEIHRDCGIVLDDTKLYLVQSRLAPLLEEQRLQSLNDLCALMRATAGGSLRQRVVEAITTNETLFFRDEPAFAALQKTLLPELIQRRQGTRKLSIWSAAASTGQEAYSVAMMLAEMGLTGWEIRILATDINSHVLERARAGCYRKIEISRGLTAEHLKKYFEPRGPEWQLSNHIRKMVEFTQFDIRRNLRAFGNFDLVLCRNVLIYFDVETKKAILKEMQSSLYEKGYLLLGCAETTLNLNTDYQKRVIDQATFYQAP
jgi:chemotaxis protein methyltransferase CheR